MIVKNAVKRSVFALLAAGIPLGGARSQQWNDSRALELVRAATDLRSRQLADSGLTDYQATAHGYVTFLAQLGEGFRDPPQIVKADELALQVYWRAPNLSKQRIIGRRDTTLLPTDIQYHRDHLGIVQNNFPAIIRLGEGDEVRDVPHPLSPSGLGMYDFALTDSLRMSIPGRSIELYEMKVRPKDDRQPRVIGALYLDRENAQVVRMALSFTRAAFLDQQLEDLFVVLENGLVGTRFWLPRRQEIEIRRTATWLDYPVRGIIRGRWEIGDYQINVGIPRAQFVGPEIVEVPRQMQRTYAWPSATILDSLPPDVRAVSADEIRRVQAEARALVREQALRRARGSALAGTAISDFAHFNRIEGVALGAGLSAQLGHGFGVRGAGRYGFDDREAKGRAEFGWQSPHGGAIRAYASRDYQDVADAPERSRVVNSLAAQETGSDYTDLFSVAAAGLSFTVPASRSIWTLDVTGERHGSVAVHATPASGRFAPALPADSFTAVRARVALTRPPSLWIAGVEMRLRADISALISMRGSPDVPSISGSRALRAAGDLELRAPVASMTLASRTIGALVAGHGPIPVQELVFMGGPITAPGYDFHTLVGNGAISQRLELQLRAPFPSISLGRFGRSPGVMTAAPFVTAVALRPADSRLTLAGGVPGTPEFDRIFARRRGVYPSAGLGALLFFDLIRLDVARGLKDGRWSFYVDVNRAFWSVL